MQTKEKWLCGQRFASKYVVKQVFVTETEHYFMVQGIQDEQTQSLLGWRKRIPKSERLLFDNACDAVQQQIDRHEAAIHACHEKIKVLTAELRELDVLKTPR